jgi:hypothetical protein
MPIQWLAGGAIAALRSRCGRAPFIGARGAMKQIFDEFLHFLQQGIAAIFRFVELVWHWSIDQITKMMQVPWQNWPLWKQVLLAIVIAAVAYALFIAARQLWAAAVHLLTAFASFLAALVVTLPTILVAGLVALSGLWVMNNLKLSSVPGFTLFEGSNSGPNDNASSPQTTGRSKAETTGSKQ